MLYQVTMLDVPRDEPHVADVAADGEDEARAKVRQQYPAHTFAILFVHTIGNEDAVQRHPLRARKPQQTELMV